MIYGPQRQYRDCDSLCMRNQDKRETSVYGFSDYSVSQFFV